MRILNADGSEVESCGNAARCVARMLMEEKDATRRIETLGGPLLCSDAGRGDVTVDMGRRVSAGGKSRSTKASTPIAFA